MSKRSLGGALQARLRRRVALSTVKPSDSRRSVSVITSPSSSSTSSSRGNVGRHQSAPRRGRRRQARPDSGSVGCRRRQRDREGGAARFARCGPTPSRRGRARCVARATGRGRCRESAGHRVARRGRTARRCAAARRRECRVRDRSTVMWTSGLPARATCAARTPTHRRVPAVLEGVDDQVLHRRSSARRRRRGRPEGRRRPSRSTSSPPSPCSRRADSTAA